MGNNLIILTSEVKQAVAQIKYSAETFKNSVDKLIKLEIIKAKGSNLDELNDLLKEDQFQILKRVIY